MPETIDTRRCGACGHKVVTYVRQGMVTIERDPKSLLVMKALEGDESWGSPPRMPHPLCVDCFLGWIHLWLGVD